MNDANLVERFRLSRAVRRLGPKDQIVRVSLSRQSRRAHPELPETVEVRAVRYQRKGFRPQTLLTSLLDPRAYPATEIAELYHERWELELGFARGFWQLTAWIASPGKLPRRLDDLHREIALLVLPPRRPRRYPRAVKIKMSNFPRSR